MYYDRHLLTRLRALAGHFPVIVLTGARQTGKTTLLRQTFSGHEWVSLDLPVLADQAERDPDLFFRNHPAPILIDEVQYAPGVFRHVKALVDRDRHSMGKFILTGSQKFPLMKNVGESLAGRAAILNLEPLSVREIPELADVGPEALARGFYPELWRNPELDAMEFYSSYVATYLERDVRQLLNVQSLRDFERFLRACAVRSAQLLNLSELARDVGIKPETARVWLNVLDASGQVALLEPYFENLGKRIVKSPKLYLTDPGMLCFLLGLGAETLARSPLIGPVWETFVFAELRKRIGASAGPASLWFYRDGQGREADFLWVEAATLHPIEVKWAESPDARWFAALEEIRACLARSRAYSVGQALVLGRPAADVGGFRNAVRYFKAPG